MLSEIFGFMNDCFPNQKLILKVGYMSLGEKEIKALEERKENKTDICPICLEEKPLDDLHRNCGK